jgi:uncharacterized membrane protein (TIGR02234 family)
MRAFRSALVIVLVGTAVTLFASARQWVHVTYRETGLPTIALDLSGRDIDPLPAGLAILVVSTVLALSISRGFTHRMLAMVISLSGVAIAVSSWRAGADFDHLASITDHLEASLGRTAIGQTVTAATPWWIVSLACGVLVAVSGGALVVSGVNRPRSSSKYERSSVDGAQLSPWQALDQGVDPTSTLDH